MSQICLMLSARPDPSMSYRNIFQYSPSLGVRQTGARKLMQFSLSGINTIITTKEPGLISWVIRYQRQENLRGFIGDNASLIDRNSMTCNDQRSRARFCAGIGGYRVLY